MLKARQALTEKSLIDDLLRLAGHISKDQECAEDIAHECYIEMIEQDQEYSDRKDMIKHFCQLARKHTKRLERQVEMLSLNEVENEIAINTDPAELDIRTAIENLPDDLKTVVNFRMRGYTQREIAAFLDIATGTVNAYLNTARRRVYAAI